MVHDDFAVKFRVRLKIDGFRWDLVAIYGAAQPELKPEFLADLVRICGDERLPILVREILISLEDERRKIMTTLMEDGHSCLI